MTTDPVLAPVALVTGGARRVGRAIALELARAGADVLIHYNRSAAEAAATASEIAALGRSGIPVRADLSDPGEIEALFRRIPDLVPRLDIVVNSAAVYDRAPLDEMTAERWDALLAINLRAPALVSMEAARLMRTNPGGVIINVADVAGYRPWPNHLHYVVSKAGLIHMTRCLALELAPDIRVNAVAPGTVLPGDFQTDEDIDRIRDRTPLQKLGSPEDVGKAVVFLALGPDSITGQVITVDGGRALFSRE